MCIYLTIKFSFPAVATPLPRGSIFKNALYTFYIGQNDFTGNLAALGISGVKQFLPQVISQITSTIKVSPFNPHLLWARAQLKTSLFNTWAQLFFFGGCGENMNIYRNYTTLEEEHSGYWIWHPLDATQHSWWSCLIRARISMNSGAWSHTTMQC